MTNDINDIMKTIQSKLEDPNRGDVLRNATAPEKTPIQSIVKNSTVAQQATGPQPLRLSPQNITSEIYIIAPSQIKLLSAALSKTLAGSLNLRALTPKIQQVLDTALIDTMKSMKRTGFKKS